MNGLPLHPLVVHFPIALTFLLPLFAIGALLLVRRSAGVRAWWVPVVLAAALAGSAFLALRTGEAEEERVESVVPENAIHEHEEAAERFLVLSGVLFAVMLVGLMRGSIGTAARGLGTAGAIALIFAAVQVGEAGGELVYRHGAGSAYATAGPGGGLPGEAMPVAEGGAQGGVEGRTARDVDSDD